MRKTRSDCRVETFEKKNGLSPGTVKKPKTPSPYYYQRYVVIAKLNL